MNYQSQSYPTLHPYNTRVSGLANELGFPAYSSGGQTTYPQYNKNGQMIGSNIYQGDNFQRFQPLSQFGQSRGGKLKRSRSRSRSRSRARYSSKARTARKSRASAKARARGASRTKGRGRH